MDKIKESLLNPINIILLGIFGYLVYKKLQPEPIKPKPVQPKVIEQRQFTPKELVVYNGKDRKEIYIAIDGNVYDVSSKPEFYGPGSMYSNFAGRDASRGMAKNSFDDDVLTLIDDPLDQLQDLNPEERQSLKEWGQFFKNKYVCIGTLVNE